MRINIVSPDSFPSIDGVTVNTTLKAAHYASMGHTVNLYAPFCSNTEDQLKYAFIEDNVTEDKNDIKNMIFNWIRLQGVDTKNNLSVHLYDAKYSSQFRHIFTRTPFHRIIVTEADVTFLEEIEILFLFQPFAYSMKRFHKKLGVVVGYLHTNYKGVMVNDYIWLNRVLGKFSGFYIRWLYRKHCHKYISLMDLPHIRGAALEAGDRYFNGVNDDFFNKRDLTKDGFYFVGSYYTVHKGWNEYMDLALEFKNRNPEIKLEIFTYSGMGDEKEYILDRIEREQIHPIVIKGKTETAAEDFSKYKTLVFTAKTGGDMRNTSVAQAICMGQFVILPKNSITHRCYKDFPNVLAFDSYEEFEKLIFFTRDNNPAPVSDNEIEGFDWKRVCKNIMDFSLTA